MHSTIIDGASHQKTKPETRCLNLSKVRIGRRGHEKAGGSTRRLSSDSCPQLLFSCLDLPRRRKRTRIVGFSDLVVVEAQHLFQNFVGVLAQKR